MVVDPRNKCSAHQQSFWTGLFQLWLDHDGSSTLGRESPSGVDTAKIARNAAVDGFLLELVAAESHATIGSIHLKRLDLLPRKTTAGSLSLAFANPTILLDDDWQREEIFSGTTECTLPNILDVLMHSQNVLVPIEWTTTKPTIGRCGACSVWSSITTRNNQYICRCFLLLLASTTILECIDSIVCARRLL